MIIDDIYTAIKTWLLSEYAQEPDHVLVKRTPIVHVDWYNEQPEKLEAGEVQITGFHYPAALVRFETPQWEALGNRVYKCNAIIYIDVIQQALSTDLASHRKGTETIRARAQFEVAQKVATELNMLRGPGFGSFKMVAMEMDHSFKKLRVDTIAFQSVIFTSNDPRTMITAPIFDVVQDVHIDPD